MASEGGAPVYYCTHCQIDTGLARVCPKCHRRGTLLLREGRAGPADAGDGARPRPRSTRGSGALAPVTTGAAARAPGPRRRARPGWLLVLGVAVIALAGVGIWLATRRTGTPAEDGRRRDTRATPAPPPTRPPGDGRLFGAPRPGHRPPPTTPPRRCGERYALRVEARFAPPPPPATPGKPGAKTPGKPSGPESSVSLQQFLISGTGPRREWVLLSAQRTLRVAGRDVTIFQLDDRGAQLLDPRKRKVLRHGPGDALAPGLRPGDLVGHALATLTTDDRGGPRLGRLRRTEPLVKGLITEPLALAAWLRPAPPTPEAKQFTDRRPAPQSLLGSASGLTRALRLDSKPKGLASGLRRYLVQGSATAPTAPPRPAPAKGPSPKKTPPAARIALSGSVTLAPGALLPTHAELRITGLPSGRPAIAEIRVELKALGSGCNR